MKVLHINSYYNGSIFYKNMYDKQIDSGLAIEVFVPVPLPRKKPGTEAEGSGDLGAYTRVRANHHRWDRLLFHLKHRKIYRDLTRWFDPKSCSMVHAHSLFSNGYIALKLKQDFNVPYVVMVRNTDINIFFRYMIHLRKLGIQIMNEAKHVVFLSKSYRNRLIERYVPPGLREGVFNKSAIIPNGLDDFWLNHKPDEKKEAPGNRIKILFAGRITRGKNVSITIKACKILLSRGYEVKFTVVGGIKDRAEYRAIKAHDFVTQVEHLPKEKLIDLYRAGDIFVMPSKRETFGLVYGEAMSQGLPVIYTRGQGFDGQFDEGVVGYSVDCNSAEEIADRVIDILVNYEQISKNCLLNVGKFDWRKITREYTRLYSS